MTTDEIIARVQALTARTRKEARTLARLLSEGLYDEQKALDQAAQLTASLRAGNIGGDEVERVTERAIVHLALIHALAADAMPDPESVEEEA